MTTPDKVNLRQYSKIYTGTNQENGYTNPFLGFQTDTTKIEFKTDKSTYFHYPNTATQMHISATDLIESGAFFASMPYKADKIFKKQADYKDHENWGDSQPESNQRGVWLCTWLSGNDANPTQNPIWMDRWYDPGQLNDTLSVYTSSTSAVYDTPSQLTFDPGVWYRYDRVGNSSNLQVVNMLCCLKLRLDDWAQITEDASGNGNDAVIGNFTESFVQPSVNVLERPDDLALSLNGIDRYAEVLYSPSFDVSGNISCNAWVKSDNWKEQPSHHFISNGLRGGWSLGINNGIFTPHSAVIDASGNMAFVNSGGNFYRNIKLPGNSTPVGVATDSELYTWVLDNGAYNGVKHLYRVDFNGNIETSVEFASSIELKDIVVDQYDMAWVSNSTLTAQKYNSRGVLVQTQAITGTKLAINNSNSLSGFSALDVGVMNDGITYWTIALNGDIYVNNTIYLSGVSGTNIVCSKDNDVWVLYDTSKIMRIGVETDQFTNTPTYYIAATAQMPDEAINSSSGCNVYLTNECENGRCQDFVWVLQTNTGYLYKYDTALNLIFKVNTTYMRNSIVASAVMGDSSGYQWHRNFNYPNLNNESHQIEASVYLGTGSPLISGQKYVASIPSSALSNNDWHMFTFDINTSDNMISLYMDGILRHTVNIPLSSRIFYRYETPLILGTNIGRIAPLDTEMGNMNKLYHLGAMDDVRIYGCGINNSDIRHLYLTKFDFKDLIWNLPTGLQSYVEEIDRFFKFKMPGQKSQFYNIYLKGLQIEDIGVRQVVEDIIKDTIKKISPLYTSLYRIIWK
jgi:hypothetical protein